MVRTKASTAQSLYVSMTSMNEETARAQLRAHKLRVTAPRVAVLTALAEANHALSYTQMAQLLSDSSYDPATIYRNLIKLKESGLAKVVSRVDGVCLYKLSTADQDDHQHPHFICDDCGDISCLPIDFTTSMKLEGPWSKPVRLAQIQLRGECPDCIDAK